MTRQEADERFIIRGEAHSSRPGFFKRYIRPIREKEAERLAKGLLDFRGGISGFRSFPIGVAGLVAAAATEKDLSGASLPPVLQIIMSRTGIREGWSQRSRQKGLSAGGDNNRP